MFKTFAVACSTLVMLLIGCTVEAQTKYSWDMPTGYPENNFHTENIRQFVGDVEQSSAGKLKITVLNNASLFKANEIKRAVQNGLADIGEIIISGFSNEDPIYGIDSIPFMASSYPAAQKLWNVSKATIEARLAKQGLKVLYSVPWPPQGIFSTRAIASAADLKGAKWRAYNPNSSRIAQLLGAQPITIQSPELTQALAAGAVTSFMTSPVTAYDSKAWEQVKYYYEVNAWLPLNLVVLSNKAFNGLDKPTQEALLKSAAAAEKRGWKASAEKNVWYREQLIKNGVKVEPGSEQLISDLKKIGLIMIADWAMQTGSEGQAIIEAYRK